MNSINECRLMGFIKDKLPPQKNNKGFYVVEFFLRFLQPGNHKKKVFKPYAVSAKVHRRFTFLKSLIQVRKSILWAS